MIDFEVGKILGVIKANNSKPYPSFFYTPDDEGRCPMHNDGYYVSPELAKKMSAVLKTHEEHEKTGFDNIKNLTKFFKESNGFLIL
jgi:hypothetical protein